MKDTYTFIALIEPLDDGVYIEFPDLPGCLPCAESLEKAAENAKEALGLHLYGMEQDKDEIPEPTPLDKIDIEKGQIPLLVSVYMPLVRAKVKNISVNKTVTLPSWLNCVAESEGINFSQVLQNALKETLHLQ